LQAVLHVQDERHFQVDGRRDRTRKIRRLARGEEGRLPEDTRWPQTHIQRCKGDARAVGLGWNAAAVYRTPVWDWTVAETEFRTIRERRTQERGPTSLS
jgi:hypothetical protein